MSQGGSDARPHQNDMHPDTLRDRPRRYEATQALSIYGRLPEHLADVITDWIETDDSEADE